MYSGEAYRDVPQQYPEIDRRGRDASPEDFSHAQRMLTSEQRRDAPHRYEGDVVDRSHRVSNPF
jgi:hypothetical protein